METNRQTKLHAYFRILHHGESPALPTTTRFFRTVVLRQITTILFVIERPGIAPRLSAGRDLYVSRAFSTVHRKNGEFN
jgi:hypothetical protein